MKLNKDFLILTLVLLTPEMPCLCMQNSVEPDQLASKKPTDLDLHCLPLSLWICIKIQNQVIWLAENWKWVWQFIQQGKG